MKSIAIKSLDAAPQFFHQVARWHHQECERQGLRSSIPLREQRLQLHIQSKVLPKTFLALMEEHLVGCVSLVNYHLHAADRTANSLAPIWLSNLFVREDLRRQGIGAQLIEFALHYVKQMGCPELWLSASEYTDFYQKRDWETVRHTRLGGRVINIMKKQT